ncbi:ATP-dependent protease-like La [Indibacter alkaliphilus LW1]|uniref:ATP-dependent protease-like La n=1 Tax=Indibacter alkaliphilus (strain CCUG 57479 / KCTC 22604 / LW1) TaxID=1189612 RepID=S2DTP9_INDAL|nr:LON peptidase substrate-binding domain-containing protein [Indibacter alkaliphilus]EOZ93213.1 ATP-dependent protease-like La [Indibacter alkaliphilus LW1]
MSDYLPLFPLKLVAFPGEQLNLHIFEPRYRQLIHDLNNGNRLMGICVYLDKLMPIGTEVELQEITKIYEDGRMDVKTLGTRVFEIISFDNPMMGKLYAAGNVVYKDNDLKVNKSIYEQFLFFLREFFRLMEYEVELKPLKINSFTFSHKIGLSIEEEYELVQLEKESERLVFLIHHFQRVLPIMRDLESAKKKIRMNGHFKNLDPLDF